MSLLTTEALDQLICASCRKYLSVLPVKVYPDKSVKCGRCSTSNDGGTASVLYEMVARKLKFPCVNHFEGCKAALDLASTKAHEDGDCVAEDVNCPMCSNNMKSSYDLLHHLKTDHKDASLEKPAFWIDLDQWLHSEIYFYCKNDIFVNVGYKYAATNQQLVLYFRVYGNNNQVQKNLMHKFKLYSVDNEMPYETDDINSAQSDLTDQRGLIIDLTNQYHPRNLILCKFEMWDATTNPQTKRAHSPLNISIPDIPPTMDGSAKKAVLRFTFGHVGGLESNHLYFSDFKYWVGGRLWQLAIEKLTDGASVPHLAVFLYQQSNKHAEKGLCKVVANISLVSSSGKDENVVRTMIRGKFKLTGGWTNFLNWHALVDPLGGYVENDSIRFDVCLEVLPAVEEEASTDDIVKGCPNCH